MMAGRQPWAGVAGFYSPARDPWQIPELQAYRAEFYTKALDWLASPNIKTYGVCDVFVWGMASWDLFGIYPDSSEPGGTYRDAALVQLISRHNRKVVTAQVFAAKGPIAAYATHNALEDAEATYARFYEQSSAMPDAARMSSALRLSNDELRTSARMVGGGIPRGREGVVTESAPAPTPPTTPQPSGWNWLG